MMQTVIQLIKATLEVARLPNLMKNYPTMSYLARGNNEQGSRLEGSKPAERPSCDHD